MKRRLMVLRVVSMAAVVSGALLGGAALAQRDVSPEGARTEPTQPDPAAGPRKTLLINVLLVDPDRPTSHQPAAGALVHVHGDDDSYKTNASGQVKVSVIPTDQVALQIKVIGANVCRLQGIPVPRGDQSVNVVIDKSPQGVCKRVD